MAKNKIQRIDQEIAKVREKIAEYQDKLKTLEAQKTEAENLEIVQMVRALRLTPEQLNAMLSGGTVPGMAAARQAEDVITHPEHPAFQPGSTGPGPQIKGNAAFCHRLVRGFFGVFAFQDQIVQPFLVMVRQRLQCLSTDTAASQVAAHGKIVQQRRPLAGQQYLKSIGLQGTVSPAQRQRLIDARLHHFPNGGKRFEFGSRKILHHAGLVELLRTGAVQQLDLHGDFSFPH